MKFIKRNIFVILLMSILLILFEIFINVEYLSIFSIGFIFMCIGIMVKHMMVKKTLCYIGAFIVLVALFLTKSIWFFFMACLMFWILFRTEEGHELFFTGDRMIFPFKSNIDYVDVVIRPQIQQRKLIEKQSLKETMINKKDNEFYEDHINLSFFSGNNIIDLGNSFLSNGEKIVMIQKIYGRTRIILPRDMGLQMNISMIHGRVIFEQQTYLLQIENFQWKTPQYFESTRRINLMVTVAFGDIEVIIL